MQQELAGAQQSHRSAKSEAERARPVANGSPANGEGASAALEWARFAPGRWQQAIDVRDFIQRNVTPYHGDESFLSKPSERTMAVWAKLQPFFAEERRKGVLDVDVKTPSSIIAHGPATSTDNEVIVGLQTDAPFRRAIMPFGGLRMVENGLRRPASNRTRSCTRPSPSIARHTTKACSTPTRLRSWPAGAAISSRGCPMPMDAAASSATTAGLPCMERTSCSTAKRAERALLDAKWPSDDVIREREELAEQMRALADLATMAERYGCDITRPAANAREAVQWTYFGYLGAIKEANGAAMSIGRISSFLDIYIERDLKNGTLDEEGAQELIDQLVQKLRIVRFLRTPEYDALFSGDPYWATECVGGMDLNGRPLVTRTSFRMLHTLTTSRSGAGAEHHRALVEAAPRAVQALSASRCPRKPRRSNTRTTTSCAPTGATITALPAASRRCGSATRCSSSGAGQPWPSACFTPSTAGATR